MQRRSFMRLVGGGTVAAATVSLVGCSSDFPAEALAPWKGPGNEQDVRRWALAHAILAPSPHNRQPWLADLREANAVSLFVDRTRLLPETDPWFRQIMIGQGAPSSKRWCWPCRRVAWRPGCSSFPKASSSRVRSMTARWRA